MHFKRGDLVTRESYNNDIIFKIDDIIDGDVMLIGLNVRLCADAPTSDLNLYEVSENEAILDDDEYIRKIDFFNKDERDDYFYIPGRILHIDGDEEDLKRCLNFYKEGKVNAFGLHVKESDMPNVITRHLEEIKPDILVITGHDAYYKKKGEKEDLRSYKNTSSFVKSVQLARKYEKAHDKLIIVAGACQSNYEALLKAGANFASSPKRINIHALDPAVIALAVSLSDKSKDIDLLDILEKTKHGASGLGGIITKGTMYVGYPR